MGAGRVARRAVTLVAIGVAAGLVLAMGLAPAVVGTGMAAQAAVSHFQSLPKTLAVQHAPQRSVLLAADGSRLATFYAQDRASVPLAQVAPVMQQAIVAIEDSRFFVDGGVDLRGITRAAITDLRTGGTTQGASTLTQQYVKNLLIDAARTPAARAAASVDTVARKLQEARYAVALSKRLSKQAILQGYLNTVYFGDGTYGVQAAARHYFSVPAAQLTLDQAAVLAGVVQSPSGYDPLVHPHAALDRRNTVLARMGQLHLITPAQLAAAQAAPLGLHPQAHAGNGCTASSAPFFCEWVYSQLLANPALGATPAQRQAALNNDGLVVQTTLDPRVQAAATTAVSAVSPADRAAAALDMVSPGTGHVLAMAVNRPYGSNPAQHQISVNLASGEGSGFQAGSTFKLFTLAAALEKGIPPSFPLYAPASYTGTSFTNCTTGAVFPPYTVANAEKNAGGTISLTQATWESVNTYYVQLEERIGLCRPVRIATELGITGPGGAPLAPVPSFTLGTTEVNPLEMAGAYAAIAAHGLFCPPNGIVGITRPGGQAIPVPAPACRQVIPSSVADEITTILQGVIDGPDPIRTGGNASIGQPAAGKTGTTDGFSAAWFDGYTSTLAASAWVGDPAGGYAHPLNNITIGGTYYAHVYGGDVPARIWASAMSSALAGPLTSVG